MSAPLVVNTRDGVCWTRRTVTSSGIALYAPEGVCSCPEFVMATLPELAEHGITGSADVLPMPVGPEPQALTEQQIEALTAAGDLVVNNAVHKDLCMCDAWPERCLSTGNYYMGAWDVSGLADALPAVLGLWEQMRGGELAALRARVAELEAERHTTNEALSDAAEALRARRPPCLCPPADRPHMPGCPLDVVPEQSERAADGLTAKFAPIAALRASLEDPHDSPLHHDYRNGRDLPLGCGLTDVQLEQLGNPFAGGGA